MDTPEKLKPVSDVECLILDYGYFIELGRCLAKTFKKVWYYSPDDTEFKDVHRCTLGDGVEEIERLDDWEKPENLARLDLFIFPDLGFAPKQAYLRSIGKAVWGSGDATNIELSRTAFLKWLEKMGLPFAPYKVIKGIPALWDYLGTVERKWVKINKYREQQETFFHINITHSRPILEGLAVRFGGLSDEPVFVVQDEIEPASEIGYDGWTVDGEFPVASFAGYELKNELYLGSLKRYDDLAEPVRRINEAIAPYLKQWNDRNFISTEIRLKEENGVVVPYYIDPTMRCAGLTMEHVQENCSNLAECIWQGANGILIPPEFDKPFAVEATMHYTTDMVDGWKVVHNPGHPMIKFDHYCQKDDYCHFPPRKSNEVGVVLGLGDSVEDAIENLKENFKVMEDEPVSIEVAGFATLFDRIRKAEALGVHFSDEPLPGEEILIDS
jgi:hypothetical protein